MTSSAEIAAAYERHRARGERAWLIGLVGPPEVAAEVIKGLGLDRDKAELIGSVSDAARASELRDQLLYHKDLVAFVAESPAAWAEMRAASPDLTTALDGVFEVWAACADVRWEAVRAQIHEHSVEELRSIDLSGLVDGTPDQVRVDIESAFVDLYQVPASQTRRWLLLADAGQGKTTLVRWSCLRPPPVAAGLTPVFLSLAEYGRDAARAMRPIATFLAESFVRRGVVGAEALNDHREDLLILADGLDEIGASMVRRAVVQELVSGRWGGVVLTGRRFVADDVLGPTWTQVVRLPFDVARRRELLEKFVLARGGTPAISQELDERLRDDPVLDRLVASPLLAVFVAVLHQIEGKLPARRIELYDRVAALLMDRWTRVRSRGLGGPDRGQMMRLLGPLGWRIALTGGAAIPEATLRSSLVEIERTADPQRVSDRVDRLLGLLRTESAVLTRTPWGWGFPHLSVAQYFAAVEATRTSTAWAELLRDPFDLNRAEVVVLTAAYLDLVRGDDTHRDELIRAVLKASRRPGRYGAVHPGVVGRLLLETENVGSALYRQLAVRWCDLVFRAASYPATNPTVELAAVELLEAMRFHPRADPFGEVVRQRVAGVDWSRRSRATLEPALSEWLTVRERADSPLDRSGLVSPTGGPGGWR